MRGGPCEDGGKPWETRLSAAELIGGAASGRAVQCSGCHPRVGHPSVCLAVRVCCWLVVCAAAGLGWAGLAARVGSARRADRRCSAAAHSLAPPALAAWSLCSQPPAATQPLLCPSHPVAALTHSQQTTLTQPQQTVRLDLDSLASHRRRRDVGQTGARSRPRPRPRPRRRCCCRCWLVARSRSRSIWRSKARQGAN